MVEGISNKYLVAHLALTAKGANDSVRKILDQLHRDLDAMQKKYEERGETEKALKIKSLTAKIDNLDPGDAEGAKQLLSEIIKDNAIFSKLPVATQIKARVSKLKPDSKTGKSDDQETEGNLLLNPSEDGKNKGAIV